MTDHDDAEQHRIEAGRMLRDMGFVEQDDGTWLRTPSSSRSSDPDQLDLPLRFT